MPRVNKVAKCQKAQGECPKCGKKIAKGDGYIWWKFRYGGRRVRCLACPYPRSSELTNSDKLSRLYGAGESVEDAIAAFEKDNDIDALRSAVEDAASEVRSVGEEYRESQENIENGFNHSTSMSDELGEKADSCESLADEIESAAGDLEEQPDEPSDEEVLAEIETDEDYKKEKDEEVKKEMRENHKEEMTEDRLTSWRDEQVQKIEEFTSIEVG